MWREGGVEGKEGLVKGKERKLRDEGWFKGKKKREAKERGGGVEGKEREEL